MSRLGDASANPAPKILLIGPPGCGKSKLLSQAAGCYMADWDDGLIRIKDIKDGFEAARADLEFDTFIDTDIGDPSAWTRGKQKILEICRQSAAKTWPYKIFINDSNTYMCEAIHRQIMFQANPAAAKNYIATKPDRSEWGLMRSETENIYSQIKAMPVPVIVTAHDIRSDAEDVRRVISITSAHGVKMPAGFDMILFMKKEVIGGKEEYNVIGNSPEARSPIGKIDVGKVGLKGLMEMLGVKI